MVKCWRVKQQVRGLNEIQKSNKINEYMIGIYSNYKLTMNSI